MLKQIILLGVIIFFSITGCMHQNKNIASNNIELVIFPSGGGNFGYNIILAENDILKAEKRGIKSVNDSLLLSDIINYDSIILDKNISNKIDSLISEIDITQVEAEDSFTFDTWIIMVKIHGKTVIKTDKSKLFNNPQKNKDIKDLINIMIKASPIDIEMQSHS